MFNNKMKHTRKKSNNPINLTKYSKRKKASSGINKNKSTQNKQENQHKKGAFDTSR